jgi:hypothetical protein
MLGQHAMNIHQNWMRMSIFYANRLKNCGEPAAPKAPVRPRDALKDARHKLGRIRSNEPEMALLRKNKPLNMERRGRYSEFNSEMK